MAASPAPAQYLLVGFGAVFRSRPVEFVGSLPATVPVCSLCRCVPSDHYTLSCKHAYCGACFSDVVKTRNSSLRCPLDGKNLRPHKRVPKGHTQSEDLGALVARCWNSENGCPYAGPLDEMTRHFDGECAFFGAHCSLCAKTVLRRDLAAHVEAAHVRTERRASVRDHTAVVKSGTHTRAGRRPSKRQWSSTTSAVGTARSADEVSLDGAEGSGDAQESGKGGVLRKPCSREELQVLMEDVVSRTAEDIKRHSEKLFIELLNEIEVTKHRLLPFAEAERTTLPVDHVSVAAPSPASVLPLRRREELVLEQFEWVVDSYSRLPVGIHYVDSPAFLIVPGHRIELKACIDGIKTAELSASVRLHTAGDPLSVSGDLLWPFQRVCSFTLVHNSDGEGHVRSSFAPCDAFNGHDAISAEDDEVLVSSWLCIAQMERTVFERDYVKDDAFTILFSTNSLLD